MENTTFSKYFWVEIIKLLRPRQWIKNSFVISPLIFSGKFNQISEIYEAVMAAVAFSVASSAVYIVNDLTDIDRDRLHPSKSKTRPLAAGTISVGVAFFILVLLYLILFIFWFKIPMVIWIILLYILINVAYSYFLKNQPVIDIFTIALGFVLRVYAGAVAIDVHVSGWMFSTTLCLALYLGSIKRRQELSQSGDSARKVLKNYSIGLVNRYAEFSAICALLFYSLFVISNRPELEITIPLVLFGLFRYWYIVEKLGSGESPTDILYKDFPLALTIFLWISLCIWTLLPTS